VIRRFDAGELEGFRVPGSRYRRIPKDKLIEYARANGMPEPDFGNGNGDGGPGPHRQLALVVEDDRNMAELMARFLKRSGWEVRVARNGFDAGLLAGTLRPGLVLLDIMLPGLDGRQACSQMRANPALSGTKILAVTALRDPDSVEEIFAAGVDGYLPKPFTLSDLRKNIESLTSPGNGDGEKPQAVKDSGGATDEL
jgi:DNA-binding response OmpR family regulator